MADLRYLVFQMSKSSNRDPTGLRNTIVSWSIRSITWVVNELTLNVLLIVKCSGPLLSRWRSCNELSRVLERETLSFILLWYVEEASAAEWRQNARQWNDQGWLGLTFSFTLRLSVAYDCGSGYTWASPASPVLLHVQVLIQNQGPTCRRLSCKALNLPQNL